MKPLQFIICLVLLLTPAVVRATSNYEYKPGEYVVLTDGVSPDGKYSIAAHGEGELGYDNFHLYLMDARTGKKIGPLEEVKDVLDTNAGAIWADWSKDSRQVTLTYRVNHRERVTIHYRIDRGRAIKISGPKVEK
jgi:hypothetical protein